MFVLSTFILINLLATLVAGQYTAVVKTSTGPVQGELSKTAPKPILYASFKGIKYAETPDGSRRFKPPVPIRPWSTTLKAVVEGSVCPQYDILTNSVIGSEDCLYLNIFTPVTDLSVTPKILKPVMVWIHGGGFVASAGSADTLRPDYLLEKDVVFVSMNYRLGILGFLNLGHPNASGNAGLKDQLLALKWIKLNIAKFGGNPNKITLFGNCAGAASVGYHTISQASKGLFQQTILMGGSPLNHWAFQTSMEALILATQHARSLGIFSTDKETLLEAFHKATAKQLIKATLSIGALVTFTPSLENPEIAAEPFLTETPYRKYYTGDYKKMPQMIGFTYQDLEAFTGFPVAFLEVINVALRHIHSIGIAAPKGLEIVRDAIISGKDLAQVDKDTLETAINITTQIHIITAVDRTERFLSTNDMNEPVYYYKVTFTSNSSLDDFPPPSIAPGVVRRDELAYIFYIPSAKLRANDPVTRTIERITTMWTDFAKYGDPNPRWPRAGPCGIFLDIGNEVSPKFRQVNDDLEVLQLLSWPEEKRSLGKPGLIRPLGSP